jgi:hypothetical protein
MGLELGLGLGLNKGGYRGDAYNDLVKLSTLFIDPARPQGVKGTETDFNTAKVNPLVDRRGVVGRNLFDGFLETGGISVSTGLNTGETDRVRSVLFQSVIPSTQYQFNLTTTRTVGARFYDINKNFVSSLAITNASTFTTPANVHFFRFTIISETSTNLQIMLNEGSTVLPYEPYGKANVLMTNVAWTNLDGYRVETINGKTNVFFNLDGVDTFGALNSASAPNPTGSDDFWQLCVGTSRVNDIFGLTRNFADAGSTQYRCFNNGSFYFINISSNSYQTPSVFDTNLNYVLWGRINGRRFFIKNAVESMDEVDVNNIISQPNTQLACRSNSADGTVKAIFTKGLQGICAMQVAPQGTIDKAKVVATVAKAMKQIYGLGV